MLQTVFSLYADVLKIQLWYYWERIEYQFGEGHQTWFSRRLEKWYWWLWKYVFRTTGRLTFLSLNACLEDQSSRRLWRRVANTTLPSWKGRQAWASRRLVNWYWGLWKYVFRTTGRLTFLSLLTRLEDQSSRLIFKTAMKTCCKHFLTIIPTFWRPYCSSSEDELNTSIERGVKLGLQDV